MSHRVLVISASMGAGHDGAARELARRLEDDGHVVAIEDFLQAPPRPIGWIVRSSYEFQIKHMAWTYELLYRAWFLLPLMVGPLARFASFVSRRRIRRWTDEFGADIVVSTYPLASQALAAMRRKGRLAVPAATFLTDFGIHPVWVNPAIDLHLAVHPQCAAEASARTGGGPAEAPGPLVSHQFRPPTANPERRRSARAAMGLTPDDRAVLIVAGSWGVGAVARTFELVARWPSYTPIVVCGREERLRRRLERSVLRHPDRGRVLGWTDDMPSLMAAADVLIENAGGLTAMEAFASGLPVITFQPIAGHGRANAAAMAAAGVTTWAQTTDELFAALERLSQRGLARAAQVRAARTMFAGDAAADVVRLADAAAGVVPVPSPVRAGAGARRHRPWGVRVATRAAVVSAAVSVATVGANAAFSVATAYGVGVAHPQRGAAWRDEAFVAVRLNPTEAADPRVADALAGMHASAIVDLSTAASSGDGLRLLTGRGVEVASGGAGRHRSLPWSQSESDVVSTHRQLARMSGEPVRVVVPGRHVDGLDLILSRTAHTRVVVPNQVLPGAALGDEGSDVRARRIYVVAGVGATPDQLLTTLATIQQRLNQLGLRGAPLSDLR